MISLNTWNCLIIFWILMFANFQPARFERWDQNTLYDLEGSGSTFTDQANLWTASALVGSAKTSNCAGADIIGGYNILATGRGNNFQKSFSGLPSHNQIRLNITLYPLDSWDLNENDHINIVVDSQTFVGWTIDIPASTYARQICASPTWIDLDPIKIQIVVPHNSTSVTVQLVSMLNEDTENESCGFRDLTMIFEIVASPASSFCGGAQFPLANNWCTCPSTGFYTPIQNSGTCVACDSSCSTCSGPAANQCLTCYSGSYMVNNNTCIPYCTTPFYSTSNGAKDFCETPCPGQFAYKSGNCNGVCNAPLQPIVFSTLKACVCYGTDTDCITCDDSCASCNGTLTNQCTSCFTKFYLDLEDTDYGTGTCKGCDPSCGSCYGPDANQCLSCDPGTFLITDGGINNGTCQACNSSCASCDGPSSNNCLSCPTKFYLSLNTPSSTDGVCLACDPTCETCSGPLSTECLTCNSSSYLVRDSGMCISDCVVPFVNSTDGVNNFCDTPCPGTYAYEDGICVNSCDTLYVPQTTALVLKECICYDFKYWNSSCLATCKYPLNTTTTNDRKFCNFPCPVDKYLKYDGTCPAVCDLPSNKRQEASRLYCDDSGCDGVNIAHTKVTSTGHVYKINFYPDTCHPLAATLQYYLNTNEEVLTLLAGSTFTVTLNSDATFTAVLTLAQSVLDDISINVLLLGLAGTMDVPKKLAPSAFAQSMATMASGASSGFSFITGSQVIASLGLQNTASAWGFVGFQQFLTFFKYMNIDYPMQLELFFLLGGATDFGGAPNLLNMMTETQYDSIKDDQEILDNQTPPAKFEYYDTPSFFIKNGGGTAVLNWGAFILVTIIILVQRIPKAKNHKIMIKIDAYIRWNFVLRTFLSVSLPVSIAIFLQLRVLSGKDLYLRINAMFTMFALIHFLAMTAFIIYTLRKIKYEELKKEENQKIYGTLIDGLELESNHEKYYHILIFFRGVLLAFMTVFLQAVPLLQVLVMIFYNVGLVFFLFKKVKFEDSGETRKTRFTETFMIPMEICVALLTRQGESNKYYQVVSWLAVGLIGIMFINEVGFALITQVRGIVAGIKKIRTILRERQKKKQIAPDNISNKVKHLKVGVDENAKFLDMGSDLKLIDMASSGTITADRSPSIQLDKKFLLSPEASLSQTNAFNTGLTFGREAPTSPTSRPVSKARTSRITIIHPISSSPPNLIKSDQDAIEEVNLFSYE